MNSLRLSVLRLMTTSVIIYMVTCVLLLFTILPLSDTMILNTKSGATWLINSGYQASTYASQVLEPRVRIEEIITPEPEPEVIEPIEVQEETENSETITARLGVYEGPSGRETWYNLEMDYVVELMRDLGYSEDEYPYHVTEDGIKMFGDYIMVAANLETRPKGTILETSLGMAMVCDTGAFVEDYPEGIDIATDW